jgi:tRNA A-37 threonylcarbamoyl transferase component Bud32
VVDKKKAPSSLTHILTDIAAFQNKTSRFFPDFDLDRIRSEITYQRVIKQNDRREVHCFQTAAGAYYLKLSRLSRTKDRLRHFIFPTRRWAEWRNLNRLANAKIPAAMPVMKGEGKGLQGKSFFLITEKVDGAPLRCETPGVAKILGGFVAYLHACGVYHVDLHPANILIRPDKSPCLIDVQELYFLPWLARRWRINNLARLAFHLKHPSGNMKWDEEFLNAYNQAQPFPVTLPELNQAVLRYQDKRFRSRAKRCCKASTEFEILKHRSLQGYRRRDFTWDEHDLRNALVKGVDLKGGRVRRFQKVCIKVYKRKLLHRDRCLTSWKMSQALAVRGICVPRALGYFKLVGDRLFIADYLDGSMQLNDYLSKLQDPGEKKEALKMLARWLKKVHLHKVWQRDFKSRNVLWHAGEYFLLDLEGVKISPLSWNKRIVNLSQLNASVSHVITLKDRLRFFHYYSMAEKLSLDQRRAIYEKIWEISKTKSTGNYNLDLEKLKP